MKNTNLFKDDNGKTSLMRFATVLIVFTALFIANYQVVIREEHSFDVFMVASLLIIGLGAKLLQKNIETNKNTIKKMALITDDNGKTSSMRIAMLLIIASALFIAIYQTIVTSEHTFDLSTTLTLISFALGAKMGQKPLENLNKKKDE